MKVTKELVKEFEEEQKRTNTATAISNLLWQFAADIYRDLGYKRITTRKEA